jgi:hypothetical protein
MKHRFWKKRPTLNAQRPTPNAEKHHPRQQSEVQRDPRHDVIRGRAPIRAGIPQPNFGGQHGRDYIGLTM